MNSNIRSGKATFVPRARLLKLLGGELIKDEAMAIVELVKNSHDADAEIAEICISSDVQTPSIEVKDNGHGMNVEDLLNYWMQPAGSSKSGNREKKSVSGRRLLGEKGVGRFAVDRLGRHCELVSRKDGSDYEIVAEFDWDQFDDADLPLSGITNSWAERSPIIFTEGSGTLIRIMGLRQEWNRRMFKRLSTKLDRIISPNFSDGRFHIKLISDEFPDYSGSFNTKLTEHAPYKMACHYDSKEDTVIVNFNGDKRLIEWPGPGELWCGSLDFQLFGFDLDTESVRKVGPVRIVRSWLKDLSGISIYRDGFRVMPYGEPDDDWLRLDQRRINNPSYRLSNSQLIGQIDISKEENPMLFDQTNRGGLIENSAFVSLRNLCHFLINIFEDERDNIRNKKEKPNEGKKTKIDDVDAVIDQISSESRFISAKAGEAFAPALLRVKEAYKAESANIRKTQDRMLGIAAVGLGSSHLFRALASEVNELKHALRDFLDLDLQRAKETETLITRFDRIEDIASASANITGRFDATHREIDLEGEIRKFIGVYSGLAEAEGVSLATEFSSLLPVIVRGRADDLWRILSEFLSNSIQAIGVKDTGCIVLRILDDHSSSGRISLEFSDTGPGISEQMGTHVFQDGITSKERSAGMGLFVAKQIAERNGWIIKLVNNDSQAAGACFEIQFERFRSL